MQNTYCANYPVMFTDSTGYFALTLTFASAFATTLSTVILPALAVVAVIAVIAVVTYAVTKAVVEKVQEVREERKNNDYIVYHLLDSEGNVQYVGRTSERNLSKTKARHKNNPYRTDLELVVAYSNLTYKEARGLEQTEMLYYHTLNALNKTNNQINGVGLSNTNRIMHLEAAFIKYVENQVSNEINNIFD